MESSNSEMSEKTQKPRRERLHDRARRIDLSTRRTMRALLSVEATSFLLAAVVHAGVLVHGYEHHEAMLAESVIGAVLLAGLAMTWIRPRSMGSIAAGVQAFALLGTLIGVWTIVVGFGPRTIPDIVYHVAIVVVLIVGLRVAWRTRKTDSSE